MRNRFPLPSSCNNVNALFRETLWGVSQPDVRRMAYI